MGMKVIIILVGLFSIICSVKDFDWFINNRKAVIFVKLLGRNGARIFYTVLGVLLIIAGICLQFGD